MESSRKHMIAVLVLLIGLCSTRLAAQDSTAEAKVRVQTSNVVVDLIVTDHKGRPIYGLTADDFVLTEDGVPQKILSVVPPESGSDVSASAPATSVSLDAAAPSPKAAQAKPHLITVVLDLADNRPLNIKKSCDTVLRYLEKSLSPNDYVAIYYIDRSLHLALSFTNDMRLARDTLAHLEERLTTSPFGGNERNAVQDQINDLYLKIHPGAQLGIAADQAPLSAGPGNTNPGLSDALAASHEIETLRSYLATMNTFQAQTVFVALRAICQSYRDIPGRKSVVLFSEGFLYSEDARGAMDAVADAANRANVAFYVIDPVGLEMGGSGVLGRASSTAQSQMAEIAQEGAGSSGGRSKFDRIRTVGEQSRNEQLERLANTTGGLMVKNTNDLLPAFTRVLADGREFYTLAYEPLNKDYDGSFRKIKLETRTRGLQLRYRQGYWAIPQAQAVAMTPAAAQLIAGLRSGSFKVSVQPMVHAELLLAPDGHYSVPVSISLPGTKVPLEKEGDAYYTTLVLALVARDAEGKIVGVFQRDWRLHLDPKERSDFEKRTLAVQGRIPVPAMQRLTVDAILQMGTVVAAAAFRVAVSESSESRPGVTSILLSDHAEQSQCPTTLDPLCFQNVRLSLPAAYRFRTADRLIVYFAASSLALDPQSQKPRVGVALSLKSGADLIKTVVAENVQAMPGPTPDTVWVLAEYDLKTLRAGSYVMNAVVQDLVRRSSQTQQAQFEIE